MSTNIYQKITHTIIKNLEDIQAKKAAGNYKKKNIKLWNAPSDWPKNASTQNPYSGINTLILWIQTGKQEYSNNQYLTFNQCRDLGGKVKKGEKGVQLVKLLQFSKENDEGEEVQTGAALKAFTVFNVEQCEGLDIKSTKQPQMSLSHTNFLKLIARTGVKMGFGGNEAYYSPSKDKITLPHPTDFEVDEYFKSTLLHELSHWTAHKSRLNRDLTGRFGTQSYAMEELVAELSSAFLCAQMGIEGTLTHSTQYIDNWLSVLKNDNKAIFTAAAKANQSATYISEQLTAQSYKLAA